MALTEKQYKQMLVLEVGEGNISALQLELAWNRWAEKTDPELRYNYALITVVNLLLGMHWKDYRVRTSAGQQLELDQPFEHLIKLAARAEERIVVIEAGPVSAIASGVEVGSMEAEVPIPTPDGWFPDPHDPRYWGDPIWASRGRG